MGSFRSLCAPSLGVLTICFRNDESEHARQHCICSGSDAGCDKIVETCDRNIAPPRTTTSAMRSNVMQCRTTRPSVCMSWLRKMTSQGCYHHPTILSSSPVSSSRLPPAARRRTLSHQFSPSQAVSVVGSYVMPANPCAIERQS